MENNNDCQYRLLEKYNGISLDINSSVMVNNGNITNEYGAILLKNKGASVFSKLPTQKIEVIAEVITPEKTIVEPAQVKTKHTRNKKR